MTDSEKIFDQIVNDLPSGSEGKMFGAKCLKSANGKTAAFFWNDHMVFKLDAPDREEALKLSGARIGTHLYAPEKQMKAWISIPKAHSNYWVDYAKKALVHVEK